MIELNRFKRILEENEKHLPLLTLDEFFYGNTEEESIAPNQWGFGRPKLSEICDMLQKIEMMPDIAWVRSDITYIWTIDGFVYLTSIMDLYSRKIIAWTLSKTLEVSCVIETINILRD